MSSLQDRQKANREARRRPRGSSRTLAARMALEAAVERALAALDAIDAEADLEPSLGAPENPCERFSILGRRARPGDQTHWAGGSGADFEEVSEDEGAQCDDEGAVEEDDDRPGNDEPSLGASDNPDQTHWAASPQGDLEEQSEDEGGACEDEWADTGDKEPDEDSLCNWQDKGDQSVLRRLPMTPGRRPVTARSPHANVSGYIAVRVIT